MTFSRASEFLRTRRGFLDTCDVYRLPKQGRFVKFLRLFGFEVAGSGPGMTVRRPPARGAAASSGANQGRPAGSVDLAPRAPRRGLPADTPITFQAANPHRVGSAWWRRYEDYKIANTVGEARGLGATPQDLKGDLEGLFAILQ